MRRRNKLFDTWRKQVDIRIRRQLDEWFGEPPEGNQLRPVILRVDTAPFPEEFLPKEPISWKRFEHVVLPQAYELDVGSVYLDITEELKKRIIDTHPDKHAVATTMRKSGLRIEQLILEKVYCEVQVHIELGDLLKQTDITIIPEFEDVHIPQSKLLDIDMEDNESISIKTRDTAKGPEKMNKEAIREAYKAALKRLVSVYDSKKDVKPIWTRPVKGNSKERVIVTYENDKFEMCYKSFPDYCCVCKVMPNEDKKEVLKDYAKIFINSVYKHYWPEVTDFLKRLK